MLEMPASYLEAVGAGTSGTPTGFFGGEILLRQIARRALSINLIARSGCCDQEQSGSRQVIQGPSDYGEVSIALQISERRRDII